MIRALCIAAILCSFFALFSAPGSAQELSPEKIMSFADHLFEQKDYYRAITEYERLLFFHPRHLLAKTAEYQIAMAYHKGEKYPQAIRRFQALADRYRGEDLGQKSLFMLAETYYQKGEHNRAVEVLELYLESYPNGPQADTARLRKGWSYLKTGDSQHAAEEFQQVPAGSPLREQARVLAAESQKFPDIPRKSPVLAGSLSAVLPGAGQLYVGRPGDATASFILNGLFIWGAVEAFRQDNDVTGGILLFLETGWYLGNIYNAVSGAHKYNRRAEQDFLENLRSQYGISYSRDERGRNLFALTIRY